jgi:hypothetical protein
VNKNELARKLLSICDKDLQQASLAQISAEVTRIFLDISSETPDNLNCRDHIEYGVVEEKHSSPGKTYGLKVKSKPILLSDVMNIIENLALPKEVQEYFPDLTENEWDAVTRMITMILLAIECST